MTSPTILVADDDPPIRALLREVLRRSHYQVLEARTGQEALELIRSRLIDALLLDLMMPGLSGFDVLDSLRRDQPELLKRVIILTAASDKDLARFDPREVCAVIRKPFDLGELTRIVSDCLHAREK